MKSQFLALVFLLVLPPASLAQTTNTLLAVKFIDANTVIASGSAGTILRSTDAGNSWSVTSTGTTDGLSAIAFASSQTGIIVGGSATVAPPILKSSDAGNSWVSDQAPLSNGASSSLRAASCPSLSVWYAAGRYDKVVRSTDGGATWHQAPNITSELVTIYGMHFLDSNTGIVVGGSTFSTQTTFRTVNGGANWTNVSNTTNTLRAVHFVDGMTGYAVGNVGTVARTLNGGASWTTLTSGTTTNVYQAVSFVNANVGYVVGWGGTIIKTTNGGTTWMPLSSGTTRDLYGVSFRDVNTGIAVGANGTLLRTVDGGASWYDPQLPIQLGSFTGAYVGGTHVRLDWMTLSEINNYGFEVQRTADLSIPFSSLPNSFIPGNGTTLVPQYYTFTDSHAVAGRQFYRLKQMDLGGPVHYTDPIAVDVLSGLAESTIPQEMFLKQNYPNPFNPVTNFQFSIPASQLTILRIFDLLGREVAVLLHDVLPSGNHDAVWDASGFASGLYVARLESGGAVQTRKLALVR